MPKKYSWHCLHFITILAARSREGAPKENRHLCKLQTSKSSLFTQHRPTFYKFDRKKKYFCKLIRKKWKKGCEKNHSHSKLADLGRENLALFKKVQFTFTSKSIVYVTHMHAMHQTNISKRQKYKLFT